MVTQLINTRKLQIVLALLCAAILLLECRGGLHAAPALTGVSIATIAPGTYRLAADVAGDAITVTAQGRPVAHLAGHGGRVRGMLEFSAPSGTTDFIAVVEQCSDQGDAVYCSMESASVEAGGMAVVGWLPVVSR